jgi:uncharacterized protein YabN with tetrapyrrole methylase and pyrophosphatase domain
MGDVARGINDKLVRRHPHVFAEPTSNHTSAELIASWDEIKKAEKAARGVAPGPFDGIPRTQGALGYAAAVLKKAEKAGAPVSTGELSDVDDLGRHLLAVVAECRRRGIDPEVALLEVTNARRSDIEARLRA